VKEIRKIVARYDLLDHEREKCALATVVSVEQSSYRRIGARMLVTATGSYIGGISGGCLEGDALRRARAAIMKGKPSVVTYDTLEDDAHQIGVGLGCNGKIDVLFTPIDFTDADNPIEVLRSCLEIREPKILLQVVGSEDEDQPTELNGHLYAEVNLASLAADCDFTIEDLRSAVEEVKSGQKSRTLFIETTTDKPSLQILCEFLRPEIQLILIGDNYDIEPFFDLCGELGWILQLVGLRRKFSKAAFATATTV
jgi:xanthine/CO dehydrogenase XdhC/CoxF family maturation factor